MTLTARRLGTLVATAAGLAFVAYVLSSLKLGELRAHLTAAVVPALLVATVLYSLVVPLNALAWKAMLKDMGRRDELLPLTIILLATQAGKYLPGNVGQHIGRFSLAVAHGIAPSLLVASMTYEIALLLFADLLTAAVCGAWSGPGLRALLGGNENRFLLVVAITAAALLVIGMATRWLPRMIDWLGRRRGTAVEVRLRLRRWTLLRVIAAYCASMLCVGAGISILAHSLFPGMQVDFALLTAAFTIAWAVGFVTPGAPAGLGVREALLLVMLTPSIGAEEAALLSLTLRVVTTVGDILCFIVGMLLLPSLQRSRSIEPR